MRYQINSIGRFNRWVIIGGVWLTFLLYLSCVIGLWLLPRTASTTQVVPTALMVVIPAPTFTSTPIVEKFTPTSETQSGEGISVGSFVQISGTEGEGLRLREQPGTNQPLRFIGMDAEVFEVKDGPREVDGYTWWYLVAPYDANRAGWAASKYLTLISTPVP